MGGNPDIGGKPRGGNPIGGGAKAAANPSTGWFNKRGCLAGSAEDAFWSQFFAATVD